MPVKWTKTENPHTYSQMIFDKGAMTIQRKKESSQQLILGRLNSHVQNIKMGPYPIAYLKINKN